MPGRFANEFCGVALRTARVWHEADLLPTSQVGEVLTLTPFITNKPSQTIHWMDTRANHRAPLTAVDFLLCLEKVIQWLEDGRSVKRSVSDIES